MLVVLTPIVISISLYYYYKKHQSKQKQKTSIKRKTFMTISQQQQWIKKNWY